MGAGRRIGGVCRVGGIIGPCGCGVSRGGGHRAVSLGGSGGLRSADPRLPQGNRGKVGVVVAAYMHYSRVCAR